MNVMNYWHAKTPLPEDVKADLAAMTSGEEVCTLETGVKLLKVNPRLFSRVFMLNRTYLYRGEFLASSGETEYKECYLTEDGRAGFGISTCDWLVSVFNSYEERGFLKAVQPYTTGATKLVCLYRPHGKLVETYAILGYQIAAETIDDEAIMRKYYGDEFVDDFIQHNGQPHHVFMVRAEEPIQSKVFKDYFDAETWVDSKY